MEKPLLFIELKTVETIPSLSVPDASKCFALITFITITICMSVQRALGCNAKLIQLFAKMQLFKMKVHMKNHYQNGVIDEVVDKDVNFFFWKLLLRCELIWKYSQFCYLLLLLRLAFLYNFRFYSNLVALIHSKLETLKVIENVEFSHFMSFHSQIHGRFKKTNIVGASAYRNALDNLEKVPRTKFFILWLKIATSSCTTNNKK